MEKFVSYIKRVFLFDLVVQVYKQSSPLFLRQWIWFSCHFKYFLFWYIGAILRKRIVLQKSLHFSVLTSTTVHYSFSILCFTFILYSSIAACVCVCVFNFVIPIIWNQFYQFFQIIGLRTISHYFISVCAQEFFQQYESRRNFFAYVSNRCEVLPRPMWRFFQKVFRLVFLCSRASIEEELLIVYLRQRDRIYFFIISQIRPRCEVFVEPLAYFLCWCSVCKF